MRSLEALSRPALFRSVSGQEANPPFPSRDIFLATVMASDIAKLGSCVKPSPDIHFTEKMPWGYKI